MKSAHINADSNTELSLPVGMVALNWLGQAGFVLQDTMTTLLIDPFLSQHEGRQIPPPFTAENSPKVDFILCTHEHIDHLDLPSLQIMSHKWPEMRIIVPQPIVEQTISAGIPAARVLGVQPGEEHTLGTARLIPVPAVHAINCPPSIYNFGLEESAGMYRYLGYVVELNGVRIYHSGDTLIYEGLIDRLRTLAIDLALLPINGRNYFREQQHLVGNIDEREAAELTAAAGIKAVVPTHYEMFAANTGRPGFFVDYLRAHHPEITCYIPAHGRRFIHIK
jgi:L-ascorbate 6-phosphate lactonase